MEHMYSYPGIVTRVIDADSLIIDIDLGFCVIMKGQRLRLKGINAPELRTEEGKVAKAWLVKTLEVYGNKVFLISAKAPKKGKWGRWVVDIYTENIHINKALIETGHAVIYQ